MWAVIMTSALTRGYLNTQEETQGCVCTEERPYEDTESRKPSICKPRREALGDTRPDTLVLDFLASRTMRNFLLCKPSGLWYFVMEALPN